MVLTALAAGSVATSALMTVMGIAQSLKQDMDLLDYLASASPHVMLLALMQTGSLAAITELMQGVNLMMIMATLLEPAIPNVG
jgi:choline-glycine betaine transporter